MNRPLRVFLADLTHMGNGIATEAFPLNIGLAAAYAKKKLGADVEFTLFKYPGDLKEAVLAHKPDILGCSNYTWNSNLTHHFTRWAKSLDPELLTVWGGTNYPFKGEEQRKFLKARPAVDAHIYYEGEVAFTRLLERRLGVDRSDKVFDSALDGCQFIDSKTGAFVEGAPIARLKSLDELPSPYATGALDKFFDGKLTPLVETTRGCPFSCNFCNAGDTYFNKVNLFSDDYVREELTYVARKAASAGVGHMTLCDNNFGMVPRDATTARLFYDLREKYNYPKTLTAWTGKNSKERVIDVTRLLGDTLSISMSVQAMDSGVLKNIKRDNIKIEHFKAITEELNAQGRPQHAELIVPLPGETLESHFRSVGELLDTNVGSIYIHTLQLLHGTPYKDEPDFIERWGYTNVKYRIVPLDFGTYDGTPIFDTEPVAVDTKHMSFAEYVESRKLTLVIDVCYNGAVFKPLRQYLRSKGIPFSAWIKAIYDRLDELPKRIKMIFDAFVKETGDELWDSEEALVAYYSRPENYRKLVTGEAGGNVLYKHKVWIFWKEAAAWVDAVFALTADLLKSRGEKGFEAELEELRRFVRSQTSDTFNFDDAKDVLEDAFSYDILTWQGLRDSPPLSTARVKEPLRACFFFDPEQQDIRRDAKTRYGNTLSGKIKLVQRANGLYKLMRRAAAAQPIAA